MADVLLLTADLLFGSQVQGALGAVGLEVRIAGDEDALRCAIAESAEASALLFDLTSEQLDGCSILKRLHEGQGWNAPRTLAYYSHVEAGTRRRAELAGFDLVVPRSRMAREGAELLRSLLANPA